MENIPSCYATFSLEEKSTKKNTNTNFAGDYKNTVFENYFNTFLKEDDNYKGIFCNTLDIKIPYRVDDYGNLDTNIKSDNNVISKTITEKDTKKVLLQSTTNITQSKDTINVKTHIKRYSGNKVYENKSEFEYDKKLLEDFVINKGTDKHGNIIKHFKKIPEIEKTPEDKRTPEQKKLLKEFNDMINFAINAGIEYGVDPKLVMAIIQREVAFQGLSQNVVGKNGKGYMQLTSAPIQDYLGYAADKKYHKIKEDSYGPEMEELLISRHFDPKSAQTQEEKEILYKNIFDYLTLNEDPEFNIRLGTLVLRRYLNKSKGNVKLAAINYNGSSDKLNYGKAVNKFHQEIKASVGSTSKYVYSVINNG